LIVLALGAPLPALFHHAVTFTPLIEPKTRRPPDDEVSASARSSEMADEEMSESAAVSPLPELSDLSTWAPAWERKEAQMGVADTLARATLRRIDSMHPANMFAKQIAAMPHALVPSSVDWALSITVVRRSREVAYRRSYVGLMGDPLMNLLLMPTFDYMLMCPPFIDVSDPEGPTTVQLTTARNHPGSLTGHLVAWHQEDYSSCATATRSRFYLPTPAWRSEVEVPYSCIVELVWVHEYATEDSHARRRTPCAFFRSELVIAAAVVLFHIFRTRRFLWRFPSGLLDWIRSIGPSIICVNAAEGVSRVPPPTARKR